jgi:hypothetical protein
VSDPATHAVWTFQRMHPGEVLGRAHTVVDDDLVERWLSLYRGRPDPRPLVPAGMAMVVVMRGFLEQRSS